MRLTVRASRLLWFAHSVVTFYLLWWHGWTPALLWTVAGMVGVVTEALAAREEKA